MKIVGITGGVGCGKSLVLEQLIDLCADECIVLEADKVAAMLMTPQHKCFDDVVALPWPENIVDQNGLIDRPLMARFMYDDDGLRQAVNDIVHPAVWDEVQHQVEFATHDHNIRYFFFEAALLIECGYDKLCDELWYVYADEAMRRDRLAKNRGYSQEKITSIMAAQLSEEIFREKCSVVIDNRSDIVSLRCQLKNLVTD